MCRGEKAGDPGTEEDGELVEDSTQYDIEKLQVHKYHVLILISECTFKKIDIFFAFWQRKSFQIYNRKYLHIMHIRHVFNIFIHDLSLHIYL